MIVFALIFIGSLLSSSELYWAQSSCMNLEGHQSGPSFEDRSSPILRQYGSSLDCQNLGQSETLQNSHNLSGAGRTIEAVAKRLHVCTVASRMHPNLEKLRISCKAQGIKLEILGMNRPYHSNTDKLRFMKKYCHRLPENDLVLFIDAFDVLILANKEEIVSRFLSLNVPMLMSAEMNCWPLKESALFHPSTPSPFKYINTGGYIGWVKVVKRWLNAFDETLLSGKSDQRAAHMLFMKNPYFYALDHECVIFLSLFQVPFDAVSIDPVSRTISCSYTNSSPCVVHANGRSFYLWNQIYSAFFDSGDLK